MRRRLLVVGIVAGLLAGGTFSSWAAPQVKGGGGVGGTCATANALGKFSAAFTLACSLLTDDGASLAYTGSTGNLTIPAAGVYIWSGRSKVMSALDGNIRLTPNNVSSNLSQLDLGGAATSPRLTMSSGTISVDTLTAGSFTAFTVVGAVQGNTFTTGTRCANTGSPAVCAAAPAGSVVIAAAATAVVVNTTAITANSQVFAMIDRGLGTLLSVTCDTTSDLTTGSPAITARTAGTSFTIAVPVAPAANPMCLSYFIVN